MDGNVGGKPKRDGIKAHKAAQKRGGNKLLNYITDRESRSESVREREHAGEPRPRRGRGYAEDSHMGRGREYAEDSRMGKGRGYAEDSRLRRERGYAENSRMGRGREYAEDSHMGRERGYAANPRMRRERGFADEMPLDRETRRKREIAAQKRKQRRAIRQIIGVAGMLLALFSVIFLVRAAVNGISQKTKEAKAKAEALTLKEKEANAKIKEATAVITTAGDVIMHRPFLESSVYKKGESYDYNPIFTYMKEIYEAADFASITTEYALTDGNYSGYPTFCAPDAIADALAANGLDMCLLANNHIYDNGDTGLQRTMDVLTQKNLLYTGARKAESDKNYVVQDIKGIKVGFFDYVYETETVSGTKTVNGIALSEESRNLLNTFQEADPQSLYDNVEKIMEGMKGEGAEYTIAYLHWGVEYQTKENSYQEAIAQKLCDMGVDALIASHPHVIQPVDLLESSDGSHKMVCAYAIGNHLSNQRTEYMEGLTNGYSEDGMVVTLTIHRDAEGKIILEKADFIPTWVYHSRSRGDEYFILPLANPEEIKEATGLSGIAEDVDESLARTNGIVGEGVKKVQEALPLEQ